MIDDNGEEQATDSSDGCSTGAPAADLAAVVEKPRTEAVIDALREEGVYDPTRSVEAVDDDRVAVPVVESPIETAIDDVREVDLPVRQRGIADRLAERGFSPEEIDAAPSSWAVVGSVVLADFGDVSADEDPDTDDVLDADWREAVGEALLELHGDADTVLARGGISGTRREPSGTVVAGTGETETVHVEHGTSYALDLSRVMFSPGNKAERARMGEVVEPDERVFDMFAGVGYFALPMARAGADVTAAEVNPDAYRLLVENAVLNDVTGRLHPVLGDCRDVDVGERVDRVVMGHYDAHEYLDAALSALDTGGTLHLHEATPEAEFPDRPIRRLEAAAEAVGRTAVIADTRVVKGHSAGVVHGVVDAQVE